jgi:hypothetical protein
VVWANVEIFCIKRLGEILRVLDIPEIASVVLNPQLLWFCMTPELREVKWVDEVVVELISGALISELISRVASVLDSILDAFRVVIALPVSESIIIFSPLVFVKTSPSVQVILFPCTMLALRPLISERLTPIVPAYLAPKVKVS